MRNEACRRQLAAGQAPTPNAESALMMKQHLDGVLCLTSSLASQALAVCDAAPFLAARLMHNALPALASAFVPPLSPQVRPLIPGSPLSHPSLTTLSPWKMRAGHKNQGWPIALQDPMSVLPG